MQRPGKTTPEAVVLAATVMSGFFGALAGMAYGNAAAGVLIGSAAGLFAGVFWTRRLIPMLQTGRLKHPGSKGGQYGMAAGALAALVLHGLLGLLTARFNPDWLFTGLICGAISGFVLGNICARIASRAQKSAQVADSCPEQNR